MYISKQRLARLSICILRKLDVKLFLSCIFLLEAVDHLLQNIKIGLLCPYGQCNLAVILRCIAGQLCRIHDRLRLQYGRFTVYGLSTCRRICTCTARHCCCNKCCCCNRRNNMLLHLKSPSFVFVSVCANSLCRLFCSYTQFCTHFIYFTPILQNAQSVVPFF